MASLLTLHHHVVIYKVHAQLKCTTNLQKKKKLYCFKKFMIGDGRACIWRYLCLHKAKDSRLNKLQEYFGFVTEFFFSQFCKKKCVCVCVNGN